MVKNAISIFAGLVALIFIVNHPDQIVTFLQMFVDAARGVADALANLNVQGKGK
jgi:hypothetical protein